MNSPSSFFSPSSPLFQFVFLVLLLVFHVSLSLSSSLPAFRPGILHDDHEHQTRWDLAHTGAKDFTLSFLHYSITLDGDLLCNNKNNSNYSFAVPVCGSSFPFSYGLVPSWHSRDGMLTFNA